MKSVFQIIYASRIAVPLEEQQWMEMLRRWRTANEKRDINSVLLSVDGCFLQHLEGDRTMVEAVYKLIAQDKRHFEITQLSAQAVAQPTFDGLSLCHTGLSSDKRMLVDVASIDAQTAKGLLSASLGQWRSMRTRAIFASSHDIFSDESSGRSRPAVRRTTIEPSGISQCKQLPLANA
jgi:Sensors of blue-light using FAD